MLCEQQEWQPEPQLVRLDTDPFAVSTLRRLQVIPSAIISSKHVDTFVSFPYQYQNINLSGQIKAAHKKILKDQQIS